MHLSDIKSAVILCLYFCICPETDFSTTVTPIGVKFLHGGRAVSRTELLLLWRREAIHYVVYCLPAIAAILFYWIRMKVVQQLTCLT